MLKFLFENSEKILGLDIGYETIKIIQTTKKGEKRSIIGKIEIPLNDRIIEKDQFKNIADTANLIKDALKKAKPSAITAKKIVSTLPETFVFTKIIKLPKMKPSEYSAAIPTELANYLPVSADQFYFDFQILVVHPDESLVDILAVAAPKKLVDDYIKMAEMAGLELIALETKPISVGRALIPKNNKNGIVLIHIGTEFSRISIWDETNLRLTSTVNVGQNQLIECFGIIDKKEETKLKITDENIKDLSIPLQKIVEETLNTIKYHINRDYKPKPIEKIIICGSGTKIVGLPDYLEKQFNLKTESNKMMIDGKELEPQFVAAYGLSLREEI